QDVVTLADTWSSMSTLGAPAARNQHTVVWTGYKALVWGGWDGANPLGTGGLYDPVSNSWTATTTTGAPSAPFNHTAGATGAQRRRARPTAAASTTRPPTAGRRRRRRARRPGARSTPRSGPGRR